MTRDELLRRLTELGVMPDAYQIDFAPLPSGWVVDPVGSRGSVYLADTHGRTDEQFFTRVEDAYDRLFEVLPSKLSSKPGHSVRRVTFGVLERDADGAVLLAATHRWRPVTSTPRRAP